MITGSAALVNGGGGSAWLVDRLLDELPAVAPDRARRVLSHERLKADVHRIRVEMDGRVSGFVAKRMRPAAAARNKAAARRWLPAVGLGQHGPPFLSEVREDDGRWVWHLYEDLGEWDLRNCRADRPSLAAVLQVTARLHGRFMNHRLLDDCRRRGAVLSAPLYASSVQRGIRRLEAIPNTVSHAHSHAGICERLLGHLRTLRDEQPSRIQAIQDLGGPPTLLHGDLWPTNTLACPAQGGLRVRIIDWDQAGVGPVSYDLSAFLGRLPQHDRCWAFEIYAAAFDEMGMRLPPPAACNLLFDTAERARLASCVFWAAESVLRGHVDWGAGELEKIARWFETLQPILPLPAAC